MVGLASAQLTSTITVADASDPTKKCKVAVYYLPHGADDAIGNYLTMDLMTATWSGSATADKHGLFQGPATGPPLPLDANGNLPDKVLAFLDTLGNDINLGINLDFA